MTQSSEIQRSGIELGGGVYLRRRFCPGVG